MKAIHTREVAKTIASYQPNRILKCRPPDINPEEVDLTCTQRTRLARLRSGFCRTLNSYLHRINESDSESCPLCNQVPHDTEHLFNCSANPTDLTLYDLWNNPKDVIDFLGVDEDG